MSWMKYIAVFVISSVLIACSSEKKEEIKDLGEILPKSERSYDEPDEEQTNDSDTLSAYQERFSEIGVLDSILPYDEDLFPDRVGPEKMEKLRLFVGDEEVVFARWTFADSTLVTNALFNWFDCFGPKCKFIRIGEEKNLQVNSFQIFMNDTALVYIESPAKIDSKRWDAYFEGKNYELDWNYRLEQSRYGKVRWYNYMDKKKTRIQNEAL